MFLRNALQFAAVAVFGMICSTLSGQGLNGQAPRVVSPEILAKNEVAIRILAPEATEVVLWGDWMDGGKVEKLTKGADGVWAITVGPLAPDFYSYNLTVDGVRTLDPQNPQIKQGNRSVDNMFFLPGPEAEFEENQNVPHGQIRQVWYYSKTLATQRRMHVYTPPGYDSSDKRYPVFYLLHGGGDEDSGWSTIGRAGFILDNLLAAGKARPMIIVMPNGSLPMPANLPRVAPGETASPEVRRARTAAQNRFVDELIREILPRVEKQFRALPGRENRAIAGLSMGGGQTLNVITEQPHQFAYVGIWSAGIWRDPEGWEEDHLTFLENPRVNEWIRLLSLKAGDQDFALDGAKALDALLTQYGIKHTFQTSGGGHTWLNWRRYLNELAPQLF